MLTVVARQKIERRIARKLITEALTDGYTIRVYDGGEFFPMMSNVNLILKTMFSVDDEQLVFFKDGKRVGWVRMIYGNDGWDAICDYSTNLESLLQKVQPLIDELERIC